MRVLLLGGGAREHAIGWRLTRDGDARVWSAPGNPGLDELGETVQLRADDPAAVVEAAVAIDADLVVVGPEGPLAAGVVDALDAKGVPTLGPTRDAARLETSKAFAKSVMARAGVATASSETHRDTRSAFTHLDRTDGPYVVKADGLAAGKGVLVTDDRGEARAWAERCLGGGFGPAGSTIVIEDFLDGPELSVFALCDGAQAIPFGAARDHKRLLEGDAGPNTGGMGAFSPVPGVDDDRIRDVLDTVARPTLGVMTEAGTPYRGFLYIGLVLTEAGPKVLEFNCRLGDPEAQVLLPRLQGSAAELFAAAATGHLGDEPTWSDSVAVNVVLAAAGYPEAPEKGAPVRRLDEVDDALVFHGGTARTEEGIVAAGGRVLSVVGLAHETTRAKNLAYDAAATIEFDGKHYRRDIGEGMG